jgi:hypothetical protein
MTLLKVTQNILSLDKADSLAMETYGTSNDNLTFCAHALEN